MKKQIVWFVLLAVAAAVKILDVPSNLAISWRADQFTHRGVALSTVIFWALLITVGVLILIELVRRWRTGVMR
jgi:hypothetical protein